MDILTLSQAKKHTNNEIEKVNQTIVNVTSGIKSITQQNGNQLVFSLNDNTTIALTVTGLSQENYSTIDKNKLALLNSDILSQFTYVNNSLLFNGNTVENNKLDLSNYYTQTQINNLLSNKANSVHNHGVLDITNLSSELSNRYTKLETLSTTEINTLVNSIIKNMTWKDSVATMNELNALIGMTIGETRIVTGISTIYTYNGTGWINLGSSANIPLASITNDGQMSKEDKSKLDSIVLANLVTSINGNIIVQGDILPTTNGTQNIGSPTNRFSTIYVNEAKLSTNTLYIGDTPVLGTTDDTIMIKSDLDQSITIKTTGVGTTKIISQSNVELSTSGMNANVNVQATGSGANANISATNQVNMTAPNININGIINASGDTTVGNLTVGGNLVMNGSRFISEATTVQVEDNIIELNKNEVGTGVTAGLAGLKINRGDSDAYLMVFDETDDMFKVGNSSNLQTIASQNYVNSSITANTHTHTNKTVLDKFTEVSGQPYYNGSAIGGSGSNYSGTINTSSWTLDSASQTYKLTVNHNLNTTKIVTAFYNTSNELEMIGVTIVDNNNIQLENITVLDGTIIIK